MLTKNRSTPEGEEFWNHVGKVAFELRRLEKPNITRVFAVVCPCGCNYVISPAYWVFHFKRWTYTALRFNYICRYAAERLQ